MKRPKHAELVQMANELCDKVWYNRSFNYSPEEFAAIDPEIKKGLLASRARVEDLYPEVLFGYDDFEWGMLNGKLSAIRWALGDEWDMLDT